MDQNSLQNKFQPVKAAFWILGSMMAFSLMAIAGREIGTALDTFEIMLYRSIIGIIIVLSIAKWVNTLGQINTKQISLHFTRNIFHFIGQNLWFFALTSVSLPQLFAFEFSTPLWIAIIAPFFLNEKLTFTRGLCAASGFLGILIVAQPTMITLSSHTIAAATCAIGFAGATIATKRLTRTQSMTCILFWLTTMQAVFGFICAGYDYNIRLPNWDQFFWLTIIGFCGLSAHFCITRALFLAPAIIVAPYDFIRLPFISIIAFFLYDEIPEWSVFLGALIIFGANIFNIRHEMKLKKQTHP